MTRRPFQHPVADLVRQRYSCRTFDGQGVAEEIRAKLLGLLAQTSLPFQTPVRWGLIDQAQVRADNLFSSGTYGLIRGTRFFLAGAIRKNAARPWEDLGFGLEKAVLSATELGLSSCWIGGVFDRKRFGRNLGIGPDESLPAVVAIGRAAKRRSWADRLVRKSARASTRKPAHELFFKTSLQDPLPSADLPAHLNEALENVRLAPSASNKQPWRVFQSSHTFHFFLDRDQAYSRLMPLADLQRIDLGIALCHFQLTLEEQEVSFTWKQDQPSIGDLPAHFEYIATAVV